MMTSPLFARTTSLPPRWQPWFVAGSHTLRRIPVFLAALTILAGCADESVPTDPFSRGPEADPIAADVSIDDVLGSSEIQAELRTYVSGITIDAEALGLDEMQPESGIGIASDEGLDEDKSDAPVRALITQARRRLTGAEAAVIEREITAMPGTRIPLDPSFNVAAKPYLHVGNFGTAFHAAIKDSVAGYALRITRNGQPIYTLQWSWAQTPMDASLGWNPDRRMHVASVSKLITAMAMVRLLHEKGIDYDAKIINYLPSYWKKGPNTGNITFRHLLTHTSGFSTNGSSDYQYMKDRVAAGVSGTGMYGYQNMNYSLSRILIAIINGNISKNATFTLQNDLLWNAITIAAYEQYVNQKVFAPAGVSGPKLEKPASPARAYTFPAFGFGWNSGNLRSEAGGAAWHMSINEVLKVMHAFRRGRIVPASKAQQALDAGFGVDRFVNTSAGKLYDKNGRWSDGLRRTEQSVAAFLPDGLEIVVFVNSPIGLSGASLRGLVSNLYSASIVTP